MSRQITQPGEMLGCWCFCISVDKESSLVMTAKTASQLATKREPLKIQGNGYVAGLDLIQSGPNLRDELAGQQALNLANCVSSVKPSPDRPCKAYKPRFGREGCHT